MIADQVSQFKVAVDKALADGFQTKDALTLLSEFAVRAVTVVQAVAEATGAQKKEAVLLGCETLFDTYIEPLNLPWLLDSAVDPLIRSAIRPVVGAFIDGTVAALWARKIFV